MLFPTWDQVALGGISTLICWLSWRLYVRGEGTKAELENGGKARIARKDDLAHIVNNLWNRHVSSGAGDKVADDAVNPDSRGGVLGIKGGVLRGSGDAIGLISEEGEAGEAAEGGGGEGGRRKRWERRQGECLGRVGEEELVRGGEGWRRRAARWVGLEVEFGCRAFSRHFYRLERSE